ncbi:hypothetical protein BJ875DRAFT_372137, partial [Amylocarpus encephaloides]
KLIRDFNKDICDREINGALDPFYLAAAMDPDFVNIYPFKGGNVRTCCLFFNSLFIKYSGIVVSIGEHDEDRSKYMSMAETKEEARGTLAGFMLEKGEGSLRRLMEFRKCGGYQS